MIDGRLLAKRYSTTWLLGEPAAKQEVSGMITLNCDMGEAFGLYRMGDDAALMPLIDVANVACGFHASDFNHMRTTVRLAKQHGVAVGAHPSLPDLQGFGRREMAMKREEMANCLIYQIGALKGFLEAEGMALSHIKPHGSLYGMAARLDHIAQAMCDAADVFQVPLFGMRGTLHETVYRARGHRFVAEYYADLEYTDQGGLIITQVHDPVDSAAAAARCVRAIREGVTRSTGGVDVPTGADSICVHSDTPNAVEVARTVRAAILPLAA
jgi:5-oxoprolinase (ATP-hydrolysing) subunit A